MITRNTGMDLLPLHGQPSHPRARLRALRDARARREREAPPPDEAFDAERLRRDMASLPPDIVVNGEEREHLRKMGWTDDRLARAQEELRRDLDRRVHRDRSTSAVAPVTASGGTGHGVVAAAARPLVAGLTPTHRRAIVANMKAAWAAGLDPYELWPSLRGLHASANPERPASPGQGALSPSSGARTGSTPTPGTRPALGATGRRPR